MQLRLLLIFILILLSQPAQAWFDKDFRTGEKTNGNSSGFVNQKDEKSIARLLVGGVWLQYCRGGNPTHTYLDFTDAGTINYSTQESKSPNTWSSAVWEVKDDILEISYNNRYAVDKYKITNDSGVVKFVNFYSKTRKCKVELSLYSE